MAVERTRKHSKLKEISKLYTLEYCAEQLENDPEGLGRLLNIVARYEERKKKRHNGNRSVKSKDAGIRSGGDGV